MRREQWQNELQELLGSGNVAVNEPMKNHTYFRIGGPADALVEPGDEEVLTKAIKWCIEHDVPYRVIGNGTNLLVRDKGIRGVVIRIGDKLASITVEPPLITAQAGALLSRVAETAIEHSLKGFEFAAGIPGSIGGALIMNAGAYDREMKNVVRSARIVTRDGEVQDWDAGRIGLGYRHSEVAAQNATVLSVTIELEEGNKEEIRAEVQKLNRWRRERQPLAMPSAGSTFKRPPDVAGSLLIDQAGLKGFTIGGAQVSTKHAGFVVNIGGATAQDVLDVMAHVQKVVRDKFGIELEPEVKVIGEK